MPQFDVSFYFSQAFWMLISFGLLYVMMVRWICPMIEKTLSNRHMMIQKGLDEAETMNQKAEESIQKYHQFVLHAEQEKAEKIQKGYEEILKKAAEKEADNERVLQQRVREAELKILATNDVLAHESEVVAHKISDELEHRFLDKGE